MSAKQWHASRSSCRLSWEETLPCKAVVMHYWGNNFYSCNVMFPITAFISWGHIRQFKSCFDAFISMVALKSVVKLFTGSPLVCKCTHTMMGAITTLC